MKLFFGIISAERIKDGGAIKESTNTAMISAKSTFKDAYLSFQDYCFENFPKSSGYFNHQWHIEEADDEFLLDLRQGLYKIKQLEWKEDATWNKDRIFYYSTNSNMGDYQITHYKNKNEFLVEEGLNKVGICGTLEEAKQIAQNHFKTLVRKLYLEG